MVTVCVWGGGVRVYAKVSDRAGEWRGCNDTAAGDDMLWDQNKMIKNKN